MQKQSRSGDATTKKTEKRAKVTLESILGKLKENRQLLEKAHHMLDRYTGIPVKLFKRPGHKYIDEQTPKFDFISPEHYHTKLLPKDGLNVYSKVGTSKQVLKLFEEKSQEKPIITFTDA